ncbi:MAG: hypothetical protein ACSW8J_03305 [bacterium]
MTITAMEILERCRRAEGEKRRLKERADMIRDTAGHMTSSLDGIGTRSSGETDHMAGMAAMLDAVERELAQRDREYTAEVAAACQLMDMLPALECGVMSRYYIRGQTLRSIARDMGYSYISRCKTSGCQRLLHLGEGAVMRLLPQWYIVEYEKRQR